jgi:hypothetical protein
LVSAAIITTGAPEPLTLREVEPGEDRLVKEPDPGGHRAEHLDVIDEEHRTARVAAHVDPVRDSTSLADTFPPPVSTV